MPTLSDSMFIVQIAHCTWTLVRRSSISIVTRFYCFVKIPTVYFSAVDRKCSRLHESTSQLTSLFTCNSQLDRSKEEPGEIAHRKLGTSLSIDPSMTQRSNYDYFGGSTSTFKDVTSPTIAPLYSFSSQNVDGYTSFQRPHAGNHSTIDRLVYLGYVVWRLHCCLAVLSVSFLVDLYELLL